MDLESFGLVGHDILRIETRSRERLLNYYIRSGILLLSHAVYGQRLGTFLTFSQGSILFSPRSRHPATKEGAICEEGEQYGANDNNRPAQLFHVGERGLEPPRFLRHRFLKPACIPVSPLAQCSYYTT